MSVREVAGKPRQRKLRGPIESEQCQKLDESEDGISPERKVAKMLVKRHLDALKRLAKP